MQTLSDVGLEKSKKLLKNAVYGKKDTQTIKDKIFALLFQKLVYPQIWEDPQVDLEALELNEKSHVVTIASGGCNALSYLIASPEKITAVDLNHAHVALVKLKISAIKELDYGDFYRFFGEAKSEKNIDNYKKILYSKLDEPTKEYWDSGILGFQRIQMFKKGFYSFGLLGKLIGFLHFGARLYGVSLEKLLIQKNKTEQASWFDLHVAKIFDSNIFKKISSSPFALFYLGIPPKQYMALCDGQPENMAQVLKERAKHLATVERIDRNYFAWQAFGRKYDHSNQENLPQYLQLSNFNVLKNNISKLSIEQNNIVDVLRSAPGNSVDSVILLDAQDWMSDDEIYTLWIEITRTARQGAKVIFRTAGVASPIDSILTADLANKWQRNNVKSDYLWSKDRSGIYGAFHLYEFQN